jgi:diguanylate cyclase (GGDEF)-like protein
VVQFAGELFPGATGDLLIVNNSRDAVEAVASWGAAHAQPAPFPPGHCWALRRGIRHTVARGTASAQCQHLTGTQPALYACVPLAANGELLGVLHLRIDQPNEENTLLDLAGRFSEAVALALANLRLRETLRWQSIRDPLTGLFNRRYLEASFEREVKRSDRQGRPIGVIMLDLDHFKHFNDANGHDDGDAFLRELGNLLGTSVRADDIACRFGGEEFILVLPEAPLEATRRRAEELREAIARLRVQHRGRQLPTVTASLGVAVFPDHGANVGELIRAADDALYQAKSGGRNRLAIAPLDDEDDGARPVRLLRAS